MEALTWAAIGAVTTSYIMQRHAAKKEEIPEPVYISAQKEVDPTRWRHRGDQPIAYHDGNRAPNVVGFQTEFALARALGY